MSKWITIHTTEYLHEAYLIKAQLELEGVDVNIPDELTSQVAPHYIAASNGVRIQVIEGQEEKALDVLYELAYLKVEDEQVNNFAKRIQGFLSKIPLICRLRFELQLLISTSILLLFFIVPFVIANAPTMQEEISGNPWCVYKMTFNGEELIQPEMNPKACSNVISFEENGDLFLTSIHESNSANWLIQNEKMKITVSNNDQNILNGVFTIRISEHVLILTSQSVYLELVKMD